MWTINLIGILTIQMTTLALADAQDHIEITKKDQLPRSCVLAADCYAKIADIYKEMGNMDKANGLYDQARGFIKKQKRYNYCRLDAITEKCYAKFKTCSYDYRLETVIDMKRRSGGPEGAFYTPLYGYILRTSDVHCWDYSLYFCRMDQRGYWDDDLYEFIKVKNNINCQQYPCSDKALFEEYHIKAGKRFPDDFPLGWAEQFDDMRRRPQVFKENFHVTPEQFDIIFEKLTTYQPPMSKIRPDVISAKEKLCITLEFLASGSLQRHIASSYRVSKQYVGQIIAQTCDEIYECLKKEALPPLTTERWTDIANRFHSKWNFPNCVGAIDGKHIAIKCPNKAGSIFYNYKGYHSIVLMAVADADYRFVFVDVGAYGSEGDSTIFQTSAFGKSMLQKTLRLPPASEVDGQFLPFMFLGDDAFPLHMNLMKPFKPGRAPRSLTEEERIFNYRLSRARRCVENSFGILCSKWFCLGRTLIMSPDRVQKVVKACCILHNYLIAETSDYCPAGFGDTYDSDGNLIPGYWRQIIPSNSISDNHLGTQQQGRPSRTAVLIRQHLKNYFNSELGSLSWQNRSVFAN